MNMLNPLAEEFERLHEQMDELRRRFLSLPGRPLFCPPVLKPPVDVCETEDSITVIVEIPGVDEDTVAIHLHGYNLEIRGQKSNSLFQRDACSYLQMEICCGPFERIVKLPAIQVDADQAEAAYKDGFLEIVLPKVKQNPAHGIRINIE